MKTPFLQTERLILRPVSLDDAPAIQKYINNWNIVRNLSAQVPWPYPDNGAESFLKDNALPRMEKGESFIWAVTVKEHGDECVGVLDFGGGIGRGYGRRGFWLAEDFQGQGYMTEAVAAVNDFAFFELGLESFTVVNAKSNIASRRIKEKTGAKLLHITELLHNSGETESEVWEVTKENWMKTRSQDE